MLKKNAYLIIDIGTGNVRAALADETGKVIHLERDTVHYTKDSLYPDALYFDPNQLWLQISSLINRVLNEVEDYKVAAVTSGSQREGIVLIDKEGNSLIGFPNHDHRGKEWEDEINDKHEIYSQTGRFPSSLFSAMKLLAVKKRQPELYTQVDCMMSISDWAAFKFTGIKGYEHSQASETLLYDIQKKQWADQLCSAFSIEKQLLPPLISSGTILGMVLPQLLSSFKLPDIPFITGGADTQLAVQSTQPQPGDIVIVSGTTTPVVKIIDRYVTDTLQRTWTNRHTDENYFILETNAGITGLNLQRLKEVFYPYEGYEIMEKEIMGLPKANCVASLGSLIAGEVAAVRGGFVFDVPIAGSLQRADFVYAILIDMAACIKANLEILIDISGYEKDFVWACGGGFQSMLFLKHLAAVCKKTIRIRNDFQHASVVGGVVACNLALGKKNNEANNYNSILPDEINYNPDDALKWKAVRNHFAD